MTENEAKQFNKGLRTGIALMVFFVVPAIIIAFTNFSEPEEEELVWQEALIIGICWIIAFIVLHYKAPEEKEQIFKLPKLPKDEKTGSSGSS